MQPSDKAPEIDKFLKQLMGKDRRETILNKKCMTCTGDAESFRDEISRKEYTISGMCQKCQDEVFGK